jgi:hypothetical protein
MGPFAAERAGAVEIMTDLCEDEKLHGSLMASGTRPAEFTLLLHLCHAETKHVARTRPD